MGIGFNEVIDVRDESIIRNNEHPKFKIGDVINNGYGNFIVKGFTRSDLGLCYALYNGHSLIGWLTEQVDAKCYLIERKQSINYIIDKYIKSIYIERCGDKFYGILRDKNGATFEFSKDVIDIEKHFNNTHRSLYEDADIRKTMLMNCFKRIFIGLYESNVLLHRC